MKKIATILTACVLLSPTAHSLKAQLKKTFEIRIMTPNMAEGTKIYLLYQSKGSKFFDSALIVNRSLVFTGQVEKPTRATLVVDSKQLGLAGLLRSEPAKDDLINIYIHPGISKGVSRSTIGSIEFPDPGINHDFAMLNANMKMVHDQWAVVSRQLVKETDTISIKTLRHLYDSLRTARIPILRQFVLDHPDSFIALQAWEEYKGLLTGNMVYAMDEASHQKSRELFETLSDRIKNSDDAMEARRFFANNKDLKPGALAPGFSQPDVDGKLVHLSEFRGTYVLLDFWASWCGPCRENNPALKKLYEEFKTRNFTILGISLDAKDGKIKWQNAIKDDGLVWTQVSDLQHWDNAVVKLYSVPAVPYNLLIGPDGKIISNDTPVENLRPLLQKLLPPSRQH